MIRRVIYQSDKHITSKGKKKHSHTHTHGNLLTQTFGFLCYAVSQKLTFCRSFVECHFLPAVHLVQAQTCQPAVCRYNTTVISSPLSDCLSPPLTLTWTHVKDGFSRMAGDMWLFKCLHREDICHNTECPVFMHTRELQNAKQTQPIQIN